MALALDQPRFHAPADDAFEHLAQDIMSRKRP
jgi:hypothetical protein